MQSDFFRFAAIWIFYALECATTACNSMMTDRCSPLDELDANVSTACTAVRYRLHSERPRWWQVFEIVEWRASSTALFNVSDRLISAATSPDVTCIFCFVLLTCLSFDVLSQVRACARASTRDIDSIRVRLQLRSVRQRRQSVEKRIENGLMSSLQEHRHNDEHRPNTGYAVLFVVHLLSATLSPISRQ